MPHCPPKHIVVAVDFGEASARAVDVAGRIASRFGARLTALHAETIDVPAYFTHEQLDVIEAELERARGVAETAVRSFVGAHTSAVTDVKVARRGPVQSILDAAAEADLIVMGTHGRRGAKRWWLGSVAERVVRESPAPVLVVHDAAPTVEVRNRASGPVLVLTSGDADRAESRSWADVLGAILGTSVQDGPPVDECASTGQVAASAIVVPTAPVPDERTVNRGVAALARTCTAPVLFVPSSAPTRQAVTAGSGSMRS